MHKSANDCSSSLYSAKSWIWLFFSLYYFVPLYYIPFEGLQLPILIGVYCVFVGLYLWAITLSASQVWKAILALCVLSIVTTAYTPGASTFFSYVGFLIGFSYGTKIWLNLLAFLALVIIALHYTFNYPIPFFALPALSGLITISIIGYVERVRLEARISQQKSHEEIEQLAVIAERERIARDLHDILGHTLSSIALKAELAEKLLTQDKPDHAKQHVSELHQIARNTLSLVRQTVSGYKHRGLSGEVMELCDKLRQNGFVVELMGEIPQLTPRAETALILALTELTTNVLRHSNGNHCQIEFRHQCDKILVSMRDNGKVSSLIPGNGLQGIQERLNALAGDLQSSIHKGCEFVISLPRRELHQ
ncbi:MULTISPECIES: sensor histidine kinase [Cellvibrio]|jgi:two-component system sensor histidine kinase DesK|uniref:sensor histidine kinase n=1 Tax=Cellvibrio TaxID=10 RepID=UPI0009C1FE95|nr:MULTISPECIES: sensor histidine kinase [Cellvibrio]AQT60006.1 sensor histidine kinase [Cellvibrio sp. PSBB023]